ncbi:2-octaprenyl-6-methoxyphenyl hydroxylase [Psychromonas sp. RZ22]|uniref:2-octaprenyl-6-methoxyphenyl hydroxylase n=1 Tax=Psychromonas algarum TaxID=2555643 RepID=UPI001068705E|nr:2-octaprenyl-6-methoxyphenyl hydroxylase [Psychromonas sp. RZ22]TEW53761.1 2-octaprenyl-6-methoxyphenyl hydroxylase [Psychromonas sp. RZ22]
MVKSTSLKISHAVINDVPIYDVVIVGAGMSGSLLALSLLKQNKELNILLLDENAERVTKEQTIDPSHTHPSFDARCIALSSGSVDILNDLSLWADIRINAQPIKQIEVSDRGAFGALDLTSDIDAFGYVVELRHVGKILARTLASFSSLTTLYNVKLNNLQQTQNHVICDLNNGQVAYAKLCVGADGSNSQVRHFAKINTEHHDYKSSAVICNVRCSKPHQSIAYERFSKNGPIALLPLLEDRYSLVYCVDNDQAETITKLSDKAFLQHLQCEFGYRSGLFEEAGKRDIYPLSLIKTIRPIAHRIVCIGNAAHSLHPVAGQGFNLGLRDLHVLANIVSKAGTEKIGSFSMLNHYWMCRESDHNNTILMTDSLVRLFSNKYHLFSLPRNIGLQAMSFFPFLSVPIIEQAKGKFEWFNGENLS